MHNFSDEQVEVAAVASINSHRSRAGLPTLAALDGVPNADEWRDDARAALVAAQEAAPQAESECLCYGVDGVTEPKCPTCSVLPSSTVDEDALAEVIGSLEWGYMVDGPSVNEIARAVAAWLKGQGR